METRDHGSPERLQAQRLRAVSGWFGHQVQPAQDIYRQVSGLSMSHGLQVERHLEQFLDRRLDRAHLAPDDFAGWLPRPEEA